jgi:hypothetical protein
MERSGIDSNAYLVAQCDPLNVGRLSSGGSRWPEQVTFDMATCSTSDQLAAGAV